jgi:hypothetical protein
MSSQLRVNTITSTTGVGTVTLGSGGVSFSGTPTFNDVTLSSINGNAISGNRNRIINGDMRIDQRYSGTLLTGAANPNYFCDRFGTYHDIGTLNYRQNLNGVTPPVGFTNYLGITNTSASTSASTNYYNLFHPVEGYNIADFAWGTASAKPITLSFWVMSSIAGIYSLAFNIASNSYGYPATYTISQANTWTYVSLTIPGSTVITPNTTNGSGVVIIWDLGQGSSYRFTAGSWQSGTVQGATGSTNWNQTNGATFYLTGVQLEAGTVATPFERRLISQELEMCQRYYEKSYDYSVIPGSVADAGAWESISINVADFYDFGRLMFKTRKRSTAVVSLWSTNGVAGQWRNISANSNQGNSGSSNASETGAHLFCNNNAMTANNAFRTQWTASAEL